MPLLALALAGATRLVQGTETSVAKIEKRKLSKSEFETDFLHPGRPVILQGVLERWGAMGKWSHEFFRSRYGSDSVKVAMFPEHGHKGRHDATWDLSRYIDAIGEKRFDKEKRPPYLIDCHSILRDHPELLTDIRPGDYFENLLDRLPDHIRSLPYLAIGFVLLGPAGAVYNLHADIWSLHAWLAQFEGRKRLVVYPPDQSDALYGGAVDPDEPDLIEFPRFREARGRCEGILEPGEIAFLPSKWWHQVTSLDPSLSITGNFLAGNNLPLFVSDLEEIIKSSDESYKDLARMILDTFRPANREVE